MINGNLIHQFSIKYKKIIKNILINEIYNIIKGFDFSFIFIKTFESVIIKFITLVLLLILYIDLYLLY